MGRIFISYHSHDMGGVVALHVRGALIDAGYEDVHAYTATGSGPEVALPWRQSLRRDLLASQALIVVTSPGSSSDWCVWEASVFREVKPHAPCVELITGTTQGSQVLNDRQAHLVDGEDPASLATAVTTVLQVLQRSGVGKEPAITSPFPGLRAFEEHQASLFFGRDDDVRRLAEPLLGRRTCGALAVIGPSGSGKSSLVKAGLLPVLRRAGRTIADPVTPSGDVLSALGSGCQVVVLDQAEELLPDGGLSSGSSELVRELIRVSRTSAWVVCTLRADFLDAFLRHQELAPLLRDDFLVAPLAAADLPEVVNGPLRQLGWSVDDAALGLIQHEATGESLPLLAFALEHLWRQVNPDGRQPPRPITRAEYVASGRVRDGLRRQADEALALARDLVRNADGSWPRADEAEQRVLGTFKRLVAVDRSGTPTRRVVAGEDLSPDERRLLEPFVANRVLTAGRHTLEVAHESLFVHWPRLQASLDVDRQALRARHEIEELAAEWVHHPDQLIAPSRLSALLAVLSPGDDTTTGLWPQLAEALGTLQFSATACDLLRASLQQHVDDEVRRISSMTPDEAMQALAGDTTAVRVLLHAPDLFRWRAELFRAMAADHRYRSFDTRTSDATCVAWGMDYDPERDVLATGSKDGTVQVWDIDTSVRCHVFDHGAEVTAIAWPPYEDVLASAGADSTVRIWSFEARRAVRALRLPERPTAVVLHPETNKMLVTCSDGTGYEWPVESDDDEPSGVLASSADDDRPVEVRDVDIFSNEGGAIAIARSDGRVEIIKNGERVVTGPAARPAVRHVRFSTDDRLFASVDEHSGTLLHYEETHWAIDAQAEKLAWADITRLATASANGTIGIWDTVTGKEVLRLRGRGNGIRDLTWLRQDQQLAAVADDGSTSLWNIGPAPLADWYDTHAPVEALAWNRRTNKPTVGFSMSKVGHTERSSLLRSTAKLDKWSLFASPSAAEWSPASGRLAHCRRNEVFVDGAPCGTAPTDFTDVRWSSNDTLVAVSEDLALIYDSTLKRLGHHQRMREPGRLTAVTWHPRGEVFALASDDGLITVRSVERALHSYRTGKQLTSIAWRPDGNMIAAGCTDATVLLLLVDDAITPFLELRGHTDRINAVTWSPKGDWLVTASDDHTARLWDPDIGGQHTALIGHSDAVTAALFAPMTMEGVPDSFTSDFFDTFVITGSADCTVRFWSAAHVQHPISGSPRGAGVPEVLTEARLRLRAQLIP